MKKILFLLMIIAAVSCNNKTNKTAEVSTALEPDTLNTVLLVEGMTCDHCEMTVQGSVAELEGAIQVTANHEDSTAVIQYDASKISLKEISEAIEAKGYKVLGEK